MLLLLLLAATLILAVLLLAVQDRDELILELVGGRLNGSWPGDCADKEKRRSLRSGRGHQSQWPAPTRQAHT